MIFGKVKQYNTQARCISDTWKTKTPLSHFSWGDIQALKEPKPYFHSFLKWAIQFNRIQQEAPFPMIHNCAKSSIGTRVKHEAPPIGYYWYQNKTQHWKKAPTSGSTSSRAGQGTTRVSGIYGVASSILAVGRVLIWAWTIGHCLGLFFYSQSTKNINRPKLVCKKNRQGFDDS